MPGSGGEGESWRRRKGLFKVNSVNEEIFRAPLPATQRHYPGLHCQGGSTFPNTFPNTRALLGEHIISSKQLAKKVSAGRLVHIASQHTL